MKFPGFRLGGSAKPAPAARTEATGDVSVLGAFRCGTNYLKFLLERNYDVRAHFSAYGWKHAGVPIFAKGSGHDYPAMPVIFVVKNPYAFVLSLHKHSIDNRKGIVSHEAFDDFLRKPIVLFDSQLEHSPQLRFSNPVQYWNFVYWNLETLDRERFSCIGFNYEDLLADPALVRRVETVAGLKRQGEEIHVPQNQMRRLGPASKFDVSQYETKESFDLDYYVERKYLARLTPPQIAFISGEADPWIMAQRNYAIL
jgi:hypothetical protein